MHASAPRAAATATAATKATTHMPAMELWRWALESPAVHLVTRRLAGNEGLLLHDAVAARSYMRGRSEESVFAEDTAVGRLLRRGLSFVELGEGEPVRLLRRGLPKFFDLDVGALDESLRASSPESKRMLSRPEKGCGGVVSRSRRVIADQLAQRLWGVWLAGKSVGLVKLAKANGDNAQVSFFARTEQWVLCSKNVALLARERADVTLPQWADHRYRFARSVAELWFDQLGLLAKSSATTAWLDVLRERLSSVTLVGELIGGTSHLVDYCGERALRWFAVVPLHGDEPCWPPLQSLRFLSRSGLPTVSAKLIGPSVGFTAPDQLIAALRGISETVVGSSLAEEGEGCVLYFVARCASNTGVDNCAPAALAAEDLDVVPTGETTISLGKLKTAEYRALRRLREKAKHFAKAAGSVSIEDILSEYRTDLRELGSRAEEYISLLDRTCRYIFVEDLSPHVVDESFLEVLSKAREFRNEGSVPMPAAPLLCLLAPPLLVDQERLRRLREKIGVGSVGDDRCPERLCSDTLSAVWHRSSAAHATLYLNHVPSTLERAIGPVGATADSVALASPPQKKRRRRGVTLEERQAFVANRMADELRNQRLLCVFWGWSDEGCARCLDLASAAVGSASGESAGRVVPMRENLRFLSQDCLQREALVKKWRLQSERLQNAFSCSSALWLPSVPGSASREDDDVALESIAQRFEALRTGSSGNAGGGRGARAVVITVLPVGLPGMGKSSLLQHLYQRCRRSAGTSFHQGRADNMLPRDDLVSESRSNDRYVTAFEAVAILSSDTFTGEELRTRGLAAESCTTADLSQCRRVASGHYKCGIEHFMSFVASEMRRSVDARESEVSSSEKGPTRRYLLLLDKNYPPAGLRREAEVLTSLAPTGSELYIKAVALTAADQPPETITELEDEEVAEFGPWQYPWSLDVLAECAARLLLRPVHDTLVGSERALFVLLSFLRLHYREKMLGHAPGVKVIKLPFVSLTGELASWANVAGNRTDDAAAELASTCGISGGAVWRRFEVRALLQKALRGLRPFDDTPSSDGSCRAPIVAALTKCLHASGLRSPLDAVRRSHVEQCSEILLGDLLEPAGGQERVVASVRYVALSVEAHNRELEVALRQASVAMRSEGRAEEEPFPVPPYRCPAWLHVTTLYLGDCGAGPMSEERRSLLSASRQLHRAAASFDCVVTHVVCARGALAAAVVDTDPLRSSGVPLDKVCRPHITLRTRPPWSPRHSAAVLDAVDVLLSVPIGFPGCWSLAACVENAVLDVFVYRLESPLVLPRNLLHLH